MDTKRIAWTVTRYGGPSVLEPIELSIPQPAPTEVLIKVYASAVSRADSMMRAGMPKFARLFLGLKRPRASLSGTCFSGEVVACGKDVSYFKQGDRIFGEAGLAFGANSTHICLPEKGTLVHKPDFVTHEEAAILCDGALTSWYFLHTVAELKPNEKILILGGAGSLGSAAVQFAAAMGARVTATASGRNAKLIEDLGATRVIDYNQTNALADGVHYDVIFDTLGISRFGQTKNALAKGGRYVCPVLSLRLLKDMLLTKPFGLKSANFAAVGLKKPSVHRDHLQAVLSEIEKGAFSPLMDRTYPFSDLVEAHQYVETGHKRGNVVLV